jgi:hypothetical protein
VRQRAMWASGDFAVIGTTLQIVGESLCEAADLLAGSRVLDVAVATATPPWPPPGASAELPGSITSRSCWRVPVCVRTRSTCL